MSKFLSKKYINLAPYTPGEQPKNRKYVKLNTNESPFSPSKKALSLAKKALKTLNLYCDPEFTNLKKVASIEFNVGEENLIFSNGSDEVLNYAFMAYCDDKTPAVFADITYGFYKVFAEVNNVPYETVPLKEDFSLDIKSLCEKKGTLFIANPNAPTGIALTLDEIEKILKSRKSRMVIIDEAYIDFGGESAVSLIDKYDNLLVTQTFSKSRQMAGARLGIGFANSKVIDDLNRIRYSLNPYNVNATTQALGIGSLQDKKYFEKTKTEIIENREYLTNQLKSLGFTLTNSKANFVFAKTDKISGKYLYLSLKERGVLVRYFDKPRISDYNRITVGNKQEINKLLIEIKDILENIK